MTCSRVGASDLFGFPTFCFVFTRVLLLTARFNCVRYYDHHTSCWGLFFALTKEVCPRAAGVYPPDRVAEAARPTAIGYRLSPVISLAAAMQSFCQHSDIEDATRCERTADTGHDS